MKPIIISQPHFAIGLLILLMACKQNDQSKNETKNKEMEETIVNNMSGIYTDVSNYASERKTEFDQIPADRKKQLEEIAVIIGSKLSKAEIPQLVFICTHNSRRSHISQIWAQAAARIYGVYGVECYSGGTEVTAFNPKSVEAMKRCGFKVEEVIPGDNPIYHVYYAGDAVPVKAWSKKYDDLKNPRKDFCAVMTCSQADEACPVVFGASDRFSIPYEDPKKADGTPEETEVYDERIRQISREMLYLFSKVKI